MNQVHAVVGVIVGIVANSWTGRIVPPFIWGLIWCGRLLILPGAGPRPSARRYSAVVLAAEYLKAVLSSLLMSLFIGSLKALFRFVILG
jgi:hypothetical protein